MELILLGSGSPVPRIDRAGPAAAVRVDGDLLVFDAGRGVVTQIQRAGLSPRDVSALFVTHHHSDHICDLADMLFSNWIYDFEVYLDEDFELDSYGGRNQVLEVLGPTGTSHIVDVLHNDVYRLDLKFRAAEVGRPSTWDSDLNVRDVEPGVVFERPGRYRVVAAEVEHGSDLGGPEWTCLGYRVECGGSSICIVLDAAPSPGLIELAKDADLLVLTCAGPAVDIENDDMAQRHDPYFSWAPQAGEIAEAAGVRTLLLTHMMTPNEELILEEVATRYSGRAILGRDLMRFELGLNGDPTG